MTERKFLVRLKRDVIAPLGVGRLIGPQTLLMEESELESLSDVIASVYENIDISFPLDPPGGAGAQIEQNQDNWGVGPSGLEAAAFWSKGIRGSGVRIGIADSGLDRSAVTFSRLRLAAFAGFRADGIKDIQVDKDGAPIPDSSAIPSASHYHGTFCASLIVGDADGHLHGMAPEAELAVTRVLQSGNRGTVASIDSGLHWLCDQSIDIASLSLGWPGLHEEWAASVGALLDQGAVVVAAVGNEWGVPGVEPTRSPANYPIKANSETPGVLIAVGAHDLKGLIGDFSGGGQPDWSDVFVDLPDGTRRASVFAKSDPVAVPQLIAPGVDIVAPISRDKYYLDSGTSMATPHIAGLLALVLSALRREDVHATPRQAADLVLRCLGSYNTADPRIGWGRVDVMKLVDFVFGSGAGDLAQ